MRVLRMVLHGAVRPCHVRRVVLFELKGHSRIAQSRILRQQTDAVQEALKRPIRPIANHNVVTATPRKRPPTSSLWVWLSPASLAI